MERVRSCLYFEECNGTVTSFLPSAWYNMVRQHPLMTDKEVEMDKVLWFEGPSWDHQDYDGTIKGGKFRALMDLCFERADKFSLLRGNWPGAKDGPLEQALRPWLLGEYLSYGILHQFDHEAREKCYIYQASEETKAIFLAHITHLFARDNELPDGETAPLPEKYGPYMQAVKAARERVAARCDALGDGLTDEAMGAIDQEEFREVQALWQEVFDESDYDSHMEDPCFYRGDEMFFWTLTHETQCCAWVVDQFFGEKLRELGRWTEEDKTKSLGRLSNEDGLVWYDTAENT